MITQAKKLEIALKHGKKYAYKGIDHPILKGIRYHESGSIYITDTHQLLRIRNAHNYEKPFTSDVKTGEVIPGEYPKIEQVFPKKFSNEIALKKDQIQEAVTRAKLNFEIAKAADDGTDANIKNKCRLILHNAVANLEIYNQNKKIDATIFFGNTIKPDNQTRYFNAEFLYNAMQVFKDAGSTELVLKITENLGPFLMIDEENEIDVLWLPIRIPEEA